MSSYKFYNLEKNYNKSKNNIILFLVERNIGKEGIYLTYKYLLNTVEILQKDFNIFVVSKVSAKPETWVETMNNTDILNKCIFIDLDSNNIFHPDVTGEKEYYNDDLKAYDYTYNYMQDKMFTPLIENEKWLFDNFVGTICSSWFLPYERNHEIIPSNNVERKKLEKMETVIYNRLTNARQIFSFRIMSQRNLYPIHFLIRLMRDFKDSWHYGFCHDTIGIWYLHSPSLNPYTKNVKCFYFENDTRGLRELVKFPIAQMQEINNPIHLTKEEVLSLNKDKDFIFGGTFPYDVGYRLNDWKRFFQNLSPEISALVRTQTDGKANISYGDIKDPLETTKFKNKKIKDPAAFEVIDNIYKSPIVRPTIPQEQYHEEQKDYLFTIILKCFYGKYDSLNFRAYSSVANGVVPLIADDYDIDHLQIPAGIKKIISVSSNKDIEKKIKYFKNHKIQYKKLLDYLYDHFVGVNDTDKNYWYHCFKNDYFKEFYK